MKIGIFNNYKFNLFEHPEPKGLRNIVGYPDNIGNIVFLESISRETGATPISMYDFSENIEKYEYEYDMIILSLANMISESYTLSDKIMESLEKTKIPICIFSVGIQAYTKDEINKIQLSPIAKRILNLAEKSGTTIGLRGYYTKDYLDNIGIKNTEVIGCPSLFYKKPIIKNDKRPSNVLLSGSFNGNWISELKNIFLFGSKYCKSYLIQSESRILMDKYNLSENEIRSWNLDEYRIKYLLNKGYDYEYYKHPNIKKEELKNWIIKNSIFFNDFDNWLESMCDYDMHVGVRFHGSVMSTLSGVPTMILSGDMRVEEFVEYHKLPYMNISQFNDELTPDDIYKMIDYKSFNDKYDELKNNYISFLKKMALTSHQNKTNTGLNRYPEIFKFCRESSTNVKSILSFGCSSGEEVATLSMFFGESKIYGTEINDEMLESCRLKFKYIDRIKTQKEIPNMKFEMIFCMSVFCRWPDTEKIENSIGVYEFSTFEDAISTIDNHLEVGGILVIYNSNFLFEDTKVSNKYIPIGNFKDSGFVHKFSKENIKIQINHTNCVFMKTKDYALI